MEYKEWARRVRGGYVLLIVRRTPALMLCAKATLSMAGRGLPDFKLIEQHEFRDTRDATRQIRAWKAETTPSVV
jgi:hypothetical protein